MILRFRQRLSKKSKLLKKKKPWKILLRQILPSPFGKKFKLLIHKTYHHFLLGKMQQGKPEEYVLAVPGIYEETEHFLAGMFGFPNFKPARSEIIRPGQFGYWYRIIY